MPGAIANCMLMAGELPSLVDARTNAPADDAFAQLVARAAAGDTAAFEQVIIATERKVVATAWRMLGNREDARDAAQEIFLRVYKYLHRYRAGQDFHGWLYRITLNVCHDIARQRQRAGMNWRREASPAFAEDRDLPKSLTSCGDAEESVLLNQQSAVLARALQTLPEKERAALILRDLEELPTAEVARILRSRPVTIRTQVSSARRKLKLYCERWVKRGGRNV